MTVIENPKKAPAKFPKWEENGFESEEAGLAFIAEKFDNPPVALDEVKIRTTYFADGSRHRGLTRQSVVPLWVLDLDHFGDEVWMLVPVGDRQNGARRTDVVTQVEYFASKRKAAAEMNVTR